MGIDADTDAWHSLPPVRSRRAAGQRAGDQNPCVGVRVCVWVRPGRPEPATCGQARPGRVTCGPASSGRRNATALHKCNRCLSEVKMYQAIKARYPVKSRESAQ